MFKSEIDIKSQTEKDIKMKTKKHMKTVKPKKTNEKTRQKGGKVQEREL